MITWWIDGTESDLSQAVKDAGHNLINTQYACWEHPDYAKVVGGSTVIYHGSIQFCNDFIRNTTVKLYQDVSVKNYECTSYYPKYGRELLNGHYVMMPFGDLARKKEWLFHLFSVDNCIFLRPNSGLKQFTGTIIKYESFEKDLDYLRFYEHEDDLLTIVSGPELIKWEARMIVVDGKVITGSYYRINRLHQEKLADERLIKSTQKLIDDVKWHPDDIYVIDVCETNEELKVVEVGAFSYAGLYKCDRNEIVKSISEFVLNKESKENE